jgi:Fic family protein
MKETDIESFLNNNHSIDDVLADPDQQPMHKEIAHNNFKLKISSPNNHKRKDKRIIDKILLLQYAGYKNKEICKHLKMTYAQLRRYLDKMKNDDELINFKIDLK